MAASHDNTARIWDVSATISLVKVEGAELARLPCSRRPKNRVFTDEELQDPVLAELIDPAERDPCTRRGPLSWDYWSEALGLE